MKGMQTSQRANYLTRMARRGMTRRWPRRQCRICLGVLCTRQGIRTVRVGKIWLHNVSEGGVLITTRMKDLPNHFYIYFGEYQYFIGCSVVGEENGMLHLKFIREQPTEFIDILSRITDPFEFRRWVRLELYGLPEHDGWDLASHIVARGSSSAM